MSKKKDRIEDNENYVTEILRKFSFGDMITFEYLERLFGIERFEMEYGYKCSLLKDTLIQYGCILKAKLGEGYRILYPNEVPLEVYNKYAKASLKKLGKGLVILNHIDQDLLNEEEKKIHNDFERLLATIYKDNENSLLMAQALVGETRRKELGN